MPTQEKVSLSQTPQPEEQRKRHEAAMAQAAQGPVDIEVPVVSVQLPSKGKIYPLESALHERESVDIKSMTAKEEDILTSRPLIRQGKAMSTLLRSCLIDKSVDPEELLVGDRNAILIAIRVSGYGPEYDTKFDCPVCESEMEHCFNLSKVPIKPLSVDPVEPGRNLFYFDLPMSGKQVQFKLLNGAEERELTQLQERSRKAKGPGAPENNVTMRLLHQIVSFSGMTDRQQIARNVRNMPARDSLALRKFIDKISPTVEVKELVVCPSCGDESEVDVPFGADFFWPDLG